MSSHRHLETARLALIRAGIVALALALAGGLAALVSGESRWLIAPFWWPLLALFLPLVTLAERKLGPLRVHHTLGLLLLLSVLSLGYFLEPTYLHAMLARNDAAQIAEKIWQRVQAWTQIPQYMATIAATIAVPLTALSLLRRRRASLHAQLATPLLLILLVTLVGSLSYALYLAYLTRDFSPALRAAFGLEFVSDEFFHGWLVRDLLVTIPTAITSLGYVLAARWTDRSAERRCLSQRRAAAGPSRARDPRPVLAAAT